ncbi:uncharacterized protein TRIADDRAFT_61930 [Trichoplax adhaerens]|uniref:Uncharacterized protein n=1 Tax=Trichoplax adhaerens TaxID=10228 RepID=B3SCC9_TRIAD|nr:hypothetical protein TRIADDRAFT_61930 [Trichoplax adhaerens]EDV19602.1 hypothetical protein TRIADDRAFT_61930 [Trichoplax adhaerens]|eukprot:XP_002117935.1 hypothetical protein TRIADDRAFT_61930 [Trichoplax adhaerens]
MAEIVSKAESAESNPWLTDSHIQLGSLQRILSIVEKHEHGSLLHKENEESSVSQQFQTDNWISSKLLKTLSKIDTLTEALDNVDCEMCYIEKDKMTRDITRIDHLVSKVELLEDLTAHLTSVIEKQERILSVLQESVIGDYLEVNAKYHGDVVHFFPAIAKGIASLSENLNNIGWFSEFFVSAREATLLPLLTARLVVIAVLQIWNFVYLSY